MKSPTQVWFLEIIFVFFKGTSNGNEQSHCLYVVTDSYWFCPREVTLSSIHSSLPSSANHHRIYSVETTLIKICNNLFHGPTTSTSSLFSMSELPFSIHATTCCDIVHRDPPRQEPGFLLHQNVYYSFQRRNTISCYTNSKQNPGESTEILFA